jgi:hypothetical protein
LFTFPLGLPALAFSALTLPAAALPALFALSALILVLLSHLIFLSCATDGTIAIAWAMGSAGQRS